TFVRPLLRPMLSDFCKGLTTISQQEVDSAPGFPDALVSFREWAEPFAPYTLAAWGNYDRNQLRADCLLHSLPYPFGAYLNLKQALRPPEGLRALRHGLGPAHRPPAPGRHAPPRHRRRPQHRPAARPPAPGVRAEEGAPGGAGSGTLKGAFSRTAPA